jgi:serine/threonine-protein kinase HipA
MPHRDHDERTLVVLMNGVLLGEINQDRSSRVRLRYDNRYMANAGSVPLSCSMPLDAARHKHEALSPWLKGLLPDRPEVLMRWRREFRVGDQSAFGLLRHVGEDVAGAAQFVTPARVERAAAPGRVERLAVTDVAQRLKILREDPTAWEPLTGRGRFSLAGAQSKIALHFDDGQWGLPIGRMPSTHILKPAIRDLRDQDINEHVSLRAAANLGLSVPESSVQTFGNERAFVVARYDRLRMGDGWTRIHQEDMCQASGVDPIYKYEDDGGPGAPEIAALIRDHVSAGNAQRDLERFADAMIYNWLVLGTDAHAKNYSLLLAPSQIRFAPLYDLNSFLAYRGASKPVLSMKIGEYQTRPDRIGLADWRAFAVATGVSDEYLIGRIQSMAAHAPDAFNTAAKEDSLRDLGSDLPGKLVDAVRAWTVECSSRLVGKRQSASRASQTEADASSASI